MKNQSVSVVNFMNNFFLHEIQHTYALFISVYIEAEKSMPMSRLCVRTLKDFKVI